MGPPSYAIRSVYFHASTVRKSPKRQALSLPEGGTLLATVLIQCRRTEGATRSISCRRAGANRIADHRPRPRWSPGTGSAATEPPRAERSCGALTNGAHAGSVLINGVVMYPMNRYSLKLVTIAACCLSVTAGERAFGQVLQGEAAIGSWRDDKPGVRRLLTPQDLPAISKSSDGAADLVAMPAGARPQVPDGFAAELVTTSGLHKPRVIRVAPNGDLFVADSMFDSVHVLRVPAGHAVPEKHAVFARGLQQPFGIAFYPLGPNPQWVYNDN